MVWLLSSLFSLFLLFFFLFVGACAYVSLCDFVCLALLLPFVLGFCLFVCLGSCLFFLFDFVFLLPFLPHRVACRVLVVWPGIRPEPWGWESQVQDIRPPENSQPHGILINECSPRGLHLNTKTQLHPKVSKLQCWTPHSKQLAKQEHNPTH